MYLEGTQLQIKTPELKKYIGETVEILLKRDIDKSGRGYYFPKVRTIKDVFRGQVELDDGDFVSKSDIQEIALLENKKR